MGLLTDVIRDKVRLNHADEEKRREALRNFYHDRISERIGNLGATGSQNDPVLQTMTDQYLKLLNPKAKETAQRGFDLIHKIKGALVGNNPQQDQGTAPSQSDTGVSSSAGAGPIAAPPAGPTTSAAALPAVDTQQGANGPVSQPPQQPFSVTDQNKAQAFRQGPPPPDTAISDQNPATPAPSATASAKQQFAQGPTSPAVTGPLNLYAGYGDVDQAKLKHAQDLRTQEDAYYTDLAKKSGLTNPRDIAEFVGSRGTRLPTFIRPTTAASNHAQLTESMRLANNLPDTPEGNAEAEQLAAAEEVRQAKAKGTVATQLGWAKGPDGKIVAIRTDPKHPGTNYDAATGQPLGTGYTQVNPQEQMALIRAQAYNQGWKLSQDLQMQGIPKDQADAMAGRLAWNQAIKTYDFTGAGHEVQSEDAEGNAIAIALHRVPAGGTLPVMGGGAPATAPPPTPAGGPSPQTGGGATVPSPTPAPKAAPSAAAAASQVINQKPAQAPAGSEGAARRLQGVSPSTARMAATFSVPITESITQLFGDEAKTGVKPLLAYAHLADDEGASKRLGKAINLTRASLGDGIADASIGAGAGGVHVSSGGFGTWLTNKLGIPGAISEQNADMLRQALKDLTPEEREAYDATMSEMSVMAGLRSLSKSSAAISNIHLIENEMAKLGTAASSTQYLDQMQRVGNAINNAINTPGLFPKVRDPKTGKQVPVGINPDMVKQLDELPQRIKDLKKSGGPAKAPAGKANDLKGKSTEDLMKMLK